jgi:protein-S-isoprenylcysteine O-methyltransferase Ste14
MISFDPFGWFARVLPEKWLHRLIRASAVAAMGVFIVWRVRHYDEFLLKPLWFAETAIFVVLGLSFMLRVNPIDRARGMREILVPIAGSVVPFFLLAAPPHPSLSRTETLYIFWAMTTATLLTVWGMWTLRRAFSITVEARTLVTRGPYRWIRHPIYAGEIATATAVALWRFSPANVIWLALFVAIQLLRAYWEERKLAHHFTDYAPWARRSVWLWRSLPPAEQ